jgi:hypothetical protein
VRSSRATWGGSRLRSVEAHRPRRRATTPFRDKMADTVPRQMCHSAASAYVELPAKYASQIAATSRSESRSPGALPLLFSQGVELLDRRSDACRGVWVLHFPIDAGTWRFE